MCSSYLPNIDMIREISPMPTHAPTLAALTTTSASTSLKSKSVTMDGSAPLINPKSNYHEETTMHRQPIVMKTYRGMKFVKHQKK